MSNEIDILDEDFRFIAPERERRLPGGVVIDRYRCPREKGSPDGSRVLVLTQAGDRFDMLGGAGGVHTVYMQADPWRLKRVRAHWEGYIAAQRGRPVKRTIKLLKEGK